MVLELIDLVRERRANAGQGDELSRVGKEAGIKDFFFGKKLGGFFKAILHLVRKSLVIGDDQLEDILTFAGNCGGLGLGFPETRVQCERCEERRTVSHFQKAMSFAHPF